MGRPPIAVATRRRVESAAARLRDLLPDTWSINGRAVNDRTAQIDVWAPNNENTSIFTYVVDRLEPRDLDRYRFPPTGDTMVVASWLSPRIRELLRDYGANYIDLTGNVDLTLASPVATLRLAGSDRDPKPRARTAPSLRGPKAWALLRTLVEVSPPYTAGELAEVLAVDDGYVSRALRVLADERLIDRRPRGAVTNVDWEATLRRLVRSYSFLDVNETSTWIATAGADQLVTDLVKVRAGRWAVSGSLVASSVAPIAAPEIAIIYTTDIERLATAGRLLPATTGANVILAEPFDPIVFERSRSIGDAPAVSIAQATTDLLTGPGRMPQEGEALLDWMRRNTSRWRTTTLRG